MRRIITEKDITRIVKNVIFESENKTGFSMDLKTLISKYMRNGLSDDEVKDVLKSELRPVVKKDDAAKRFQRK